MDFVVYVLRMEHKINDDKLEGRGDKRIKWGTELKMEEEKACKESYLKIWKRKREENALVKTF